MNVNHAASNMSIAVLQEPADIGALPVPHAFLGVKLHLLTMRQTVEHVMHAMRNRTPLQQVSLNVAKLMTLRHDSELASDLMQADLVSADGMGIVLGARLMGVHVPERVAGVDLMEQVLARCAEEGYRPYLLGARPEVLARAVDRLKQRFPGLHLAGFHDGYFTPLQEAGLVRKIRAAQPDCLFVGMPTPRKERFLARHRAALQIPFVMGVGGSLDILAGHVRRAPPPLPALRIGMALPHPAGAAPDVAPLSHDEHRLRSGFDESGAAESAAAPGSASCHFGGRGAGAMSFDACFDMPAEFREEDAPFAAAPPMPRPVTAREIRAVDLPAIAALLHEGFPSKSAARFSQALAELGQRDDVPGLPRYGHMLRAGSQCVGALLTIAAAVHDDNGTAERCNVACWYVRPAYRLYASLLVLRTTRNPLATHINIWPAENTWRTIRSQGFEMVCAGTFAGVPALAAPGSFAKVRRITASTADVPGLSSDTLRMLRDHARYGCISLVCETQGRVSPFVFRRRRFKRFPLPAAQLIYCRELAELRQFARPLGWYLALRGLPWLLAGANEPVGGIPGRYFDGKMAIYCKGPNPPAVGDLRYTEAAMFGF